MDDGLRNLLAQNAHLPGGEDRDDGAGTEDPQSDSEVEPSAFEAWLHGAVLEPEDFNMV